MPPKSAFIVMIIKHPKDEEEKGCAQKIKKNYILETVQDNQNADYDLLFDIMKCKFGSVSIQHMGEKRKKDKQHIDQIESEIAQLDNNLTKDQCESNQSKFKDMNNELNSIYDTKIKQKMLNNKIASYEDYEKSNNFFFHFGKQKYFDNTIHELELDNGAVLSQTTDIFYEEMKFYEGLYTSKFKEDIECEPLYEKEFFQVI